MNQLKLIALFLMVSVCVQAQKVENGTYYRTASEGTIEISNVSDGDRFTLTFNNTDGSKKASEVKAVQGTDGLYIHVGDGFFYFITVQNGYLERYIFNGEVNYATAKPCDYYEILVKDKSVVGAKKATAEMRRKKLDDGKESLYFPKLLTEYAKVPAEERFQLEKPYKGIYADGDKSYMHLEPEVWGKNTLGVLTGSRMKLVAKNTGVTKVYYRHHLDPNMFQYYSLIKYWGRSTPEEYVYFGDDGFNFFYHPGSSSVNSIFIFTEDKKKKWTQDELDLAMYAAEEKIKSFEKKMELFANSMNEMPKVPAAGMTDESIKSAALKALQKHAESKGWKEKFTDVVITSNSWNTVIKSSYTGRSIEVAAVATWPDGHCSFQYFDLISMYEGGSFSPELNFYTAGSQFDTDCK